MSNKRSQIVPSFRSSAKWLASRCFRSCTIILLVLTISLSAFSQSSGSSSSGGAPRRDPQAIAAVEQALDALGNKTAYLHVHTIVIRGNIQTVDGQAISSFLWEDDLSGKIPEFRKEIRSGNSVALLVSGHGTPSQHRDGRQRQLPVQVALALPPFYVPGVVLTRQLNNPTYSFQLVDDADGLIHVRTSWQLNLGTASVSVQDWYFSTNTKLPVRVQYVLPNSEKPSQLKPVFLEFSDFRTVTASGIAIPFSMIGHGVNQQIRKFAVTEAQINTPIDSNHFEMNGGQQ